MRNTLVPYIIVAVVAAGVGFSAHLIHRGDGPAKVSADTLPQPVTKPAGISSIAVTPVRPVQPFNSLELPSEQRAMLQGQGKLDTAGYFNCVLTNGSTWSVTDVRFQIATGQPEGSLSWRRSYRESVDLKPGQSTRISFKVIDQPDVESRWIITAARGFPPS